MQNRLLLHQCCAPCSTYTVERLKDTDFQVHGYFYNPNIHPVTEYRKRLSAVIEFNTKEGIEHTIKDYYGLREFVKETAGLEYRCGYCYESRMRNVAEFAQNNGFNAFTTTLLYSKYQNHQYIKDFCTKIAAEYGLDFWYEDYRIGWQKGIDLSKESGMYRQSYCGCIFSEEERYLKSNKK